MTRGIFGPSLPASFAWFDRNSRSWKTSQATFLLGLEKFSETWPDSGMMQNGVAYERPTSEPPTFERESLLWPTTRSSSGGGNTSAYPGAPYRPALTRNWRTPDVPGSGGPRNRQESQGQGHQYTIAEQAEKWAPPQAHDSAAGNPDRVGRFGTEHGGTLADDVTTWGTPQANPSTHNPRPVDHGKQLANQTENWLTALGIGGEFAKQATQWQTPATDAFRKPRRGPERGDGVRPTGEILSNSAEPGLEIGRSSQDGDERAAAQRNCREFPEFAPGPSDPRWPAILSERPDLSPALSIAQADRITIAQAEAQSKVCRVADGTPIGWTEVD